jgi:hypothetical protein
MASMVRKNDVGIVVLHMRANDPSASRLYAGKIEWLLHFRVIGLDRG